MKESPVFTELLALYNPIQDTVVVVDASGHNFGVVHRLL